MKRFQSPATHHLPRPLGFRIWRHTKIGKMNVPHSHADVEINFLTQARLQYRHGGLAAELSTGELGIFWGGIPHQLVEADRGLEGIWMTLPIAWLLRWRLPGNLMERLMAGEFLRVDADKERLEGWQLDFESNQPARLRVLQLEIEALFHRIGLSGEKRKSRRPRALGIAATSGRRIEQVTTFLATHYHDELSLDAIARTVGLHPKYLARAFRKSCGLSVWEYLTRLRIAHAQRLLLTTDHKMSDVALESGFGSVAPFYAAFTRHGGGRTPSQFRRDRDTPTSRRSRNELRQR